MVRRILLVFVTILLASCSQQDASDDLLSYYKGTTSVVLKPGDTIELEQYGILLPTGIIRYSDSYIIKKGLSENYLDILTLERNVIHCVKRGQGPGELIDIGSIQMEGDTLFVYGPSQRKLLVLDIPSTIKFQKQITLEEYHVGSPDPKVSDQMVIPVNLKQANGHFYGLGMFGDGSLYAELSREGTIVSGIPGPDLDEERLSSLDRVSLNMDAVMSISPDGSRIAVAYSQIAAISFGCTKPALTELWSRVFYQPKLWFSSHAGLMVSYEKENRVTFQDMQAFNDAVYILYSGKNRVNDSENSATHSNHLLVFCWDGAPLRQYELEESIVGFWIEEDTLYGISFTPAPKLYQFKQPDSVILTK